MRRAFPLLRCLRSKHLVVLIALAAASAAWCAPSPDVLRSKTSPYVREGNSVVTGNARFQVLSPTLVRLELAPQGGEFADRPSAVVVKRDWPLCEFEVTENDSLLTINTGRSRLEYRVGSDRFAPDTLSVTWGNGGTWRPGAKDDRNFGATVRSLDGVSGANLPMLGEGLLSRSGYYLYDDSATPLANEAGDWIEPRNKPGSVDWYLFVYGDDYKLALREYAELLGSVPMIPRWALGSWYSRYWPYHDTELRDIITEYRRREIPLDVLVIDVDWHTNGWEGYDWNPVYFPDPTGFLKWCQDQGVEITLNNHPSVLLEESRTPEVRKRLGLGTDEPIRFNLATKLDADVYMDVLHSPLIDEGVDFWWIDGESARMDGLNGQFWTNRVYYTGTQDHTKKRALIFSRWGGPGSHRYPVGFSGDTFAEWPVLKYEIGMTPIAGDNLWQWSHDIGGFNGDKIEGELYVRWVQFGAFSPILRLHSNHGQRLPWDYGEEIASLARDAFQLRYRLIPYTYTLYHELSATALSPCRPLYLEYPDLAAAYEYPYEYLYGSEMLVAPAAEPTTDGVTRVVVYLPPGTWYDFFTGRVYEGGRALVYACPIDRIPVFARAGAIIPTQPDMQHVGQKPVDPLIINVYRGADGEFTLYEDDGESLDYQKGVFATTRMRLQDEEDRFTLVIEPMAGAWAGAPSRRSYQLRVFGASLPNTVAVNGRLLRMSGNWDFDQQLHALTVDLGEHPVGEQVTVAVYNPGGHDAYRWVVDAADIRSRLLSLEAGAEASGPIRELADRLANNFETIPSGRVQPYDIGPRLSDLAASILDSGDTPENRNLATGILDLQLYTELVDAPQFGQGTSLVAAASWDPVLAGSPKLSVSAPPTWGLTRVDAATTDTSTRCTFSQPQGFGFAGSSMVVRADAPVRGRSMTLERSVTWADCSVTNWQIVGPFDNTDKVGLTTDYGPEAGVDLSAQYDGAGGKVAWEPMPAEAIVREFMKPSYMDLRKRWRLEHVCAYAVAHVHSEKSQPVRFDIGSDDMIVAWLNGEEILRHAEPRAAAPAQDAVDVVLKQGLNEILLKVCQEGGEWGFYFEIKSPDGGPPSGIEIR